VARRRYLFRVPADGMLIEVWSDVVCSWCYQGKRQLERALADFPDRDRIEVRWRSFELDPSIAADAGLADEELAKRRNISIEEARAMHEVTEAQGRELGIEFDFTRARRGNTFFAHRALQMAHEHGVQDAVNERLMATYFCEGGAIGDPATVARAAGEGGLDESAVAAMLAGDAFAAEVRAEEQEAHALGINSVPFFVIDRRYGLAGAHPAPVLRQAIEQAWSERQPA
jgi:predicted DsbA family dithiol-disulfide isomerase